ncbi:MAG: hypothetical protein L6V80_01490 [Bacteroidales bacterium]|nr:MAG: hypothetical protein L6V80_01490 [Bacteroidales bacterium]
MFALILDLLARAIRKLALTRYLALKDLWSMVNRHTKQAPLFWLIILGNTAVYQPWLKEIDGSILQMKEHYWVYQLALILKEKFGYTSDILKNPKEDSLSYVDMKMKDIDLRHFFGNDDDSII